MRSKTATAIAAALAGASLMGIAHAAIPSGGAGANVIHGCYQKNGGQLRVIDSSTDACRSSEVALDWGQNLPTTTTTTIAPTTTTTARPADAPTITATSVAGGPCTGGQTVTITGAHLSRASLVGFVSQQYLELTPWDFSIVSDTQIVATTRPYTSTCTSRVYGTIEIQSPAGWGGRVPYYYENQAPPVASVSSTSPDRGPCAGGQTVTLTGSGFTPSTQVTFAGPPPQNATATWSVTFVSNTQLQATTTPFPCGGNFTVGQITASNAGQPPSPGVSYTYTP